MSALRWLFLITVFVGMACPDPALAGPRADFPPDAESAEPAEPAFEGAAGVQVQPARVKVGLFYHGVTLSVRAEGPTEARFAVTVVGEEERVELKRKGKVLGVLWMNVEDVAFERVPSLYLLATSHPLDALAPPSVLSELGVGFTALASVATDEAGRPADRDLFGELVRLRERDGLFAVGEGEVHLESGGRETTTLTALIDLPAKAPPGEYAVRVYGFREGTGELVGEATVVVERTGPVRMITSLAFEHGLLYGILAVVIAVGVGLLTGWLFGMGSGRGH